jgi:hypothetical protein
MPVLDLLCRDSRIDRVTLVEPDVYKPHNVIRHIFPPSAVGRLKAELAREWLLERRPELEVNLLVCDVRSAEHQQPLNDAVASADIGVCAVDTEVGKYAFDALMRRHGRTWTLGEVLSGGIGGFIHWFVSGGPCYGCVASYWQRAMEVEKPASPDYSQPGGVVAETTVPAGKASIETIASLHAVLTLGLLGDPPQCKEGRLVGYDPGFTTLLLTLQRVPDVFEEAFRPYRARVPRLAECLICQPRATPSSEEELDVALARAIARLGDA